MEEDQLQKLVSHKRWAIDIIFVVKFLPGTEPLSLSGSENTNNRNMEDIRIRKATPDDLDVLYRFEQGVITAERPFDPTLKQDPVRYYDLQTMFTASHIHLIVATYEEHVIGCGYARIENAELFLSHSHHAYLGFMYTEPAHRGKGINRKIIHELERWAQAKGVSELRLEVYFGNTPAIKAYEKAGFSKHMITMRRASGR